MLEALEGTADTVAEVALGTAAVLQDAATVSKEARHLTRGLIKLLIVAIVIGAIVGIVAKMRDNTPPAAGQTG